MSHLGFIKQLYQKFKMPAADSPSFPDEQRLGWRISFLKEELQELEEAAELQDLPKFFDALIDLEVVLLGTVIEAGLASGWEEGFMAVHKANMAKVAGPSHREATTVDLQKPEGWEPADLERVLRICGWRKPEPEQGRFVL